MINLPVWIADWVYECCGPVMHVGELVTLELTFHGDTASASEPDNIEVRTVFIDLSKTADLMSSFGLHYGNGG